MSPAVAEILERLEHNRHVERSHRSVWEQSEGGNLNFLSVKPPRLTQFPRCNSSYDADDLDLFGIIRRRNPMLEPDEVKAVVFAGLRAEAAMIAKCRGGKGGR